MLFHTAKVMSYLEFSQLFSKKTETQKLRLRFLGKCESLLDYLITLAVLVVPSV